MTDCNCVHCINQRAEHVKHLQSNTSVDTCVWCRNEKIGLKRDELCGYSTATVPTLKEQLLGKLSRIIDEPDNKEYNKALSEIEAIIQRLMP